VVVVLLEVATLLDAVVLFVLIVFALTVVSGMGGATHGLFELLLGFGEGFVVEAEIAEHFVHDLVVVEFV
jgi:hypothetical protein